jgi:hypothetical protein
LKSYHCIEELHFGPVYFLKAKLINKKSMKVSFSFFLNGFAYQDAEDLTLEFD